MLKYSLGIDISKNDFHACLSVIEVNQQVKVKASRKFPNHEQGFKDLISWHGNHRKELSVPLVIVMEATGVYYESCAMFLFKAGLQVAIVLPNKARNIFRQLVLRPKMIR